MPATQAVIAAKEVATDVEERKDAKLEGGKAP